MKRTGLALLAASLMVACNESGSSGGSKEKTEQSTTDTGVSAAPQYLEWVMPDGYRYAFEVTKTRVEEIALPGSVAAIAEVKITNLLDRRDNRVNFPHATDRRLMLAIRQERYGGVCPPDFNEQYDYKIYVAVAGYCVNTSSGIATSYQLPAGRKESKIIPFRLEVPAGLGITEADIAVFFFDPLLSLTPVVEMNPAGALYTVNRSPICENPVSGELRPECEAEFHPDLLVPVP